MSGEERNSATPPHFGHTGETRNLAPDLQVVVAENPGPLTLDGTRTYVVGMSRVVVLDPGPAHPDHLRRVISAVGEREVDWVCLTHAHPDHAGAAGAAGEALSAPLAASEDTLGRLKLTGRTLRDGDDVVVDGGESFFSVLDTPGHSADSLSYLWLPSRRLFTGDLVLGEGTSVVAHPDGSVGTYLTSLAKLVALQPVQILPGHGEPVHDAVDRLEAYRRHRFDREEQILGAVSAGAHSVDEIRLRVYGELTAELVNAAELSILAHLKQLQETGHDLPESLLSAIARHGPTLQG